MLSTNKLSTTFILTSSALKELSYAMNTSYRITEVAKITGLSAHTLRYYEHIGLIDAIARSSGHRLYDESDIRWVQFLLRLRATGMSIAQMLQYADLRRVGESWDSVHERCNMLRQHARQLSEKITALNNHLSVIHDKIDIYTEIESRLKPTDSTEWTMKI